MFGAIDLKSGAGSPTGVNLFHMDKNPLDELYEGLDSIMGNQGEAIGTGLATFFEFTIKLVQGLIDAILGLPNEFLAEFGPLLAELEGGVLGSLLNLGTFFDNLIGFLGNVNLLDEAFTVASSVEQFITNVLTPSAWFTDLLSILGDPTGLGTGVLSGFLAPIGTITSALGHAGDLITDLEHALANIPGDNVYHTVGGVLSSLESFGQGLVNNLVQGLTQLTGGGFGLPTIATLFGQSQFTYLGYNYGAPTSPPAGSISAIAKTNNEFITLMAATKPPKSGIDPTTDGPFDIALAMNNATLPTIAVTSANSVICFIPTPHGGIKESIRWLGYPSGGTFSNITTFVLNVYKLNTTTGASALVYTSGNIVGGVATGTSPAWNAHNLPGASYFTTSQSDMYWGEIEITGTGTYNIVGLQSYLPTHPTAIPAALGATRTGGGAPATVADVGVSGHAMQYATSTPWIGLAGSAGVTVFTPLFQDWTTAGTYTYTKPTWANFFDIIVLGGGGGGGDSNDENHYGGGAHAGSWTAITLTAAAVAAASTFAITVGSGGAGSSTGAGSTGAASSVAISGYGTISGGGGAGGALNVTPVSAPTMSLVYGASPGDESFNGNTYYGGAVQNSVPSTGGLGGGGNSPGGGGEGGYYGAGGLYAAAGGHGAPGAVFILAYQ